MEAYKQLEEQFEFLNVKLEETNLELRKSLEEKDRVSNYLNNILESLSGGVLVTGESGTGKELVARALHYNSPRSSAPFIRLNCAALPKELMESELFGHEKGAFTGAIKQTRGRFEMADGGTLLLDEISEIDPALQAKLLRVLQEREFERVGSAHTIKVDVRIIATTNCDLTQQIAQGSFREDLYYRLNVIEIGLPSLRERRDDVPALVRSFIERYNSENNKNIEGISDEAMDLLMQYEWPGNVRELENYIERAVVVARGPQLETRDFPQKLSAGPSATGDQGIQVGLTVQEMERRLIMKTLEACGGNRTEAATMLDISTRTLRNKLHEYGAMHAFKSETNGRIANENELVAGGV